MRPFIIHNIILTVLIILGITLFTMEALSIQTGGWLIKKYTFTKLYWLGLTGYSLISSILVLSVGFFHKIKNKSITPKVVILSHVFLVGTVWIFINLGFHDLIQDAWKNKTKEFKHDPKQSQNEQTGKKRSPIPATSLSKNFTYKTSDKPVEPYTQKSE